MVFAFCLLAWKFVKELGKAEKRAGFGDAMSNGSLDSPPPMLASRSVKCEREYTSKRKDMCCDQGKMRELSSCRNVVVVEEWLSVFLIYDRRFI